MGGLPVVLAVLLTVPLSPLIAREPLAIDPSGRSIKWGSCPPIFGKGCEIAVLQGDPSLANADVVLRLQPGVRLAWHRHSSAERMILVSGQLRVEYAGSKPATLKGGHYAYGPAGLAHRAACADVAPCILFIAFDGPVDALAADAPAPRR